MNSASRARDSSAKRARVPGRGRGPLIALVVGLAVALLGIVAQRARRPQSRQVKQSAEGVLLAQRRAGELPSAGSAPLANPRSPASTMPAIPTPLPMPIPSSAVQAPSPRYIVHDSAPPRPAPGHLFVDTQPEAQIWIDDEAKGKTPQDVLLAPGIKVLRLEAPGFRPIRETVEAGQGAVIRRALVPLGAAN